MFSGSEKEKAEVFAKVALEETWMEIKRTELELDDLIRHLNSFICAHTDQNLLQQLGIVLKTLEKAHYFTDLEARLY